jgi:hypothetical protein
VTEEWESASQWAYRVSSARTQTASLRLIGIQKAPILRLGSNASDTIGRFGFRNSEASPLSKQRRSAIVERRVEEIVIPRNAMIADVLGSQKAQSSKHLACRVREGLDYLSLVVLVLAPEKIRIEQHFETRRDLSKKSPRLQEILIGGEQDKKKGAKEAHPDPRWSLHVQDLTFYNFKFRRVNSQVDACV